MEGAKQVTKSKAVESVWQLNRNDLEGAKRFITAAGEALTADEASVVVQLQDDPRALLAWMDKRSRATAGE